MDYAIIKPIVEEKEIVIDKGSLKTKRKFSFLLEAGDEILENREFWANDEVEVVIDYKYTNDKRPKEKIKIYKIKEVLRC
ncbi:hypothetical protein [Methanocaldococcus sp.]